MTKSTAALAKQEGVAPKAVLQDIAANGEAFAKFMKDGGDNIKNAAIQAKKLGTELGPVAGIAEGAFDFSTNAETDAAVDVSGLSVPTITTLDGTACNVCFAVGDMLHAQDDIILGEVASLDANNITFKVDGSITRHAGGETLHTNPANFAAWQVQNGAGAAGDLADNDEIYNIHPMTFIFSFER